VSLKARLDKLGKQSLTGEPEYWVSRDEGKSFTCQGKTLTRKQLEQHQEKHPTFVITIRRTIYDPEKTT
jgi:hypothetical protein